MKGALRYGPLARRAVYRPWSALRAKGQDGAGAPDWETARRERGPRLRRRFAEGVHGLKGN